MSDLDAHPVAVIPIEMISDRLSTYRTRCTVERYAEFESVDQFEALIRVAKIENRKIYILGNGSNTLFTRHRVRTMVLKNRLPRRLDDLGNGIVRASSSLMISAILKHCRANSLDSFYYLASVPATVGGALAMNAGRGRSFGLTIFDYLQELTYFANGTFHIVRSEDVQREHRRTMFTGCTDLLILEAIFAFPPTEDSDDKIQQRVEWSKNNQDHSAPNCGSVFRVFAPSIMNRLRGIGFGGARWSPKTSNWLLCRTSKPERLVGLVRFTKWLHKLFRKQCELELVEVD